MARLRKLFCVLPLGLFVSATVPAVAGDEAEIAKETWTDALKDISLGPGTLNIGGSLRFRYEFYNNYNIKQYGTEESDNMLLERLRLDIDYRLQENLHAFVQLQDAHFWFSELHADDFPPPCPHRNDLDLRQAFVEWKRIADSPVGFKVGRQTIRYRDTRVWGPGDWGNVGRYVWDAAMLSLDTEAVTTDFIFGQRLLYDYDDFDDEHYDFDAYGAYSKFNQLPFDLDLFYTQKLDDHGTTVGESGGGHHRRHTIGTYLNGNLRDRIDWGGLFAYQFGDYGQDAIDAFGYVARLGYTFDAPWKPRVGVEYIVGSGDSDPADGDHETFDNLFGAVAPYYGRMNFVSWKNIKDYLFTVSVTPGKGLKVWVDYHYFALAEAEDAWYWCSCKKARRDPTGSSGTTLGHEIDLLAKWNLNDNLELFCGYAHFFPGSFIRHTGSHHDADWAFFQTTLSF